MSLADLFASPASPAADAAATTRREVLQGLAAALVGTTAGATDASAQTAGPVNAPHLAPEPGAWEAAVRRILGAAKPLEAKIKLDTPDIAENGNTVPLAVAIESPMTDADHVRAIHVVVTGNPQPTVVTLKLTPSAGRATVATRIRLARSQDVIAIAERSDGAFLMTRKTVKVTIGGCGG